MATCVVTGGSLIFSLKYVFSCLQTKMAMLHSQNVCVSVSSKRLQKEYNGEFFKPAVKSFLFRLSVLFTLNSSNYMSIVAIGSKIHITDHCKLLVLNSFSAYLAKHNFLFFSNIIKLNVIL